MASPSARIKQGAYVGTGSGLSIETIGWKPRSVTLINQDDPNVVVMMETMDDDTGFKQKAGTSAMISSGGVTLTDDGFDIGTDADLNTDGETVHYVAHG